MARVVAHLIVGAKPEPFLPAMLASIAPATDHLFVNENSGLGAGAPVLEALQTSALAQRGRLTMARTTFSSFSQARNVCFDLDTRADADTWIVFIDADEVHGEQFTRVASHLQNVPPDTGYVDAYTWHFFMSYDWYLSIERRMMFHRWTPEARWSGGVHERLSGIPEKRIVLPYVYGHYGNAVAFSEHARKGAQYSGLGAEGTPLTAQAARAADLHAEFEEVEAYYAHVWPKLLRFRADHPEPVRAYIERDKQRRSQHFAAIDALIRKHQNARRRAANALMKLNYEQRWRARALDPAARRLL